MLLWVLLLVVIGLFVRRPTLRRAILATAEPLRRIRTDRFGYTLKAIALSALVAAPVSLLMALIGWQLATSVEAATFTKQVGQALVSISVILYYLRSFRVLCIPGGVADKHFRWPTDVLTRLRRSFDWLVFFLLPIGFRRPGDLQQRRGSARRQPGTHGGTDPAARHGDLLRPPAPPDHRSPQAHPRRAPHRFGQPPAQPVVPAGGGSPPGPGRPWP